MNHPLTSILGLLAAAAAAATALAALDQQPLLTDALIGAGAGVVVAKLLVGRLERRHGELAAPHAPARAQVDASSSRSSSTRSRGASIRPCSH